MMTKGMVAEQAMEVLLECGIAVCYKDYHMYKNAAGKYVILHFDQRGDLYSEQDEEFDVISDAVSKFVLRTKL